MSVEITPKAKKASVAFTAPSIDGASQAILTGEWDNWEVWAMKKNKNGSFSVKLEIDYGRAYQFGYSIEGRWHNDPDSPVVSSPFGTSNSILDLTNVSAPKEAAEPKAKAAAAPKKEATEPKAAAKAAPKAKATDTAAKKTTATKKTAAKK